MSWSKSAIPLWQFPRLLLTNMGIVRIWTKLSFNKKLVALGLRNLLAGQNVGLLKKGLISCHSDNEPYKKVGRKGNGQNYEYSLLVYLYTTMFFFSLTISVVLALFLYMRITITSPVKLSKTMNQYLNRHQDTDYDKQSMMKIISWLTFWLDLFGHDTVTIMF